jgi:hypothetical protein
MIERPFALAAAAHSSTGAAEQNLDERAHVKYEDDAAAGALP